MFMLDKNQSYHGNLHIHGYLESASQQRFDFYEIALEGYDLKIR